MEFKFIAQTSQDEQFQVIMNWRDYYEKKIYQKIGQVAQELSFDVVPVVKEMFVQNARFKVVNQCLPETWQLFQKYYKANQDSLLPEIKDDVIRRNINNSIEWERYEEPYINAALEQSIDYLHKYGFQETHNEIENFYESDYEVAFDDLKQGAKKLNDFLYQHLAKFQNEDLTVVASDIVELWLDKLELSDEELKLFKLDKNKIINELAGLALSLSSQGVNDVANSEEYHTESSQYLKVLTETIKERLSDLTLLKFDQDIHDPNEFINARMHFQDLADHFIDNVKYVNNEITFDELKHRVWEEGQENE